MLFFLVLLTIFTEIGQCSAQNTQHILRREMTLNSLWPLQLYANVILEIHKQVASQSLAPLLVVLKAQ